MQEARCRYLSFRVAWVGKLGEISEPDDLHVICAPDMRFIALWLGQTAFSVSAA